ncbi:unnamed protein product [Linum tenue]|uniref:YDG domain-containing protein n=1 Tax=Linum tenue TaxID=586396 RepID=A0AAV0MWG1_9ROSI|nr:unnamed protein product [Linum tenue]
MVSSRSPFTTQQVQNSAGPIHGFSGPAGGQRGVDQFRDLAVPLKKSKKGGTRTLCPPPPPDSPPPATTSPAGGGPMSTGSSSGRLRRLSPEEEKDRELVRKALEEYNRTVEVLRRGKPKSKTPNPAGVYKEAVDVLRRKRACVNDEKRLGSVPGVEIGQCFYHWGEMMVVGVHHPYRRGISVMKQDSGISLATSIVATDSKENSVTVERIVYVGEGGMPYGCTDGKLARDQKLDGGNRALENSMKMKQPVRVICKLPSLGSAAGYVYVYYGLYLAVEMNEVTSVHGKVVFQFVMRRVSGQPDLPGNRRLQRANN